jgi:hypothetical protein
MLETADTMHASSLSTSKRTVMSAKSMSGSPSYPSEEIDVSATSLSSSPSYPSILPSATSLSSSPSHPSHPRPSPFTKTNVPGVTKRGRPGSPASIDVVPEAKRFAIATKADDAKVPEHLWDLRALRLDGTLNTQEGNTLTLLRNVATLEKDHHQVTSSLLRL